MIYYNYFRDYNPALGLYLQSDPIGLDAGLNIYVSAKSKSLMDFIKGKGYIYPDNNKDKTSEECTKGTKEQDDKAIKELKSQIWEEGGYGARENYRTYSQYQYNYLRKKYYTN